MAETETRVLRANATVYFTETTVFFGETMVAESETTVARSETTVFFGETTVAVNAAAVLDVVGEGFTSGQVGEYNPTLNTIKLLFESTSPETLRNPDNVVVVPQTRDVFLCEDAGGDQFVRGLTRRGEIYDFARTGINLTEFCGACFDRGGHTRYLNQQGAPGALPSGPVGFRARTYAIFGPFRKRQR